MGLSKKVQARQIKWLREGDLSTTSLGMLSAEVSRVDGRYLVSIWNRKGSSVFEEGNILTQRKGEIVAETQLRKLTKETISY